MKDTKHIRRDFNSVPGWDVGALGVPRGSNNFFFKHGYVVYQIDGDDGQIKMQETFSSRRDFYSVAWVKPQGWDTGALRVPRGSNIFFSNMVM